MPVTSTFQNTSGTQSGQQAGTSVTQAQAPALTAQQNLSAVPDLASLTSLINSINQNAQTSANAARLPGGQALLNQQSANIGTGLKGQLDPSVVAMLQQQGAELGIGHGMGPGAPVSNAAYLKALGQTVQGTQAAAGQQLNAALSVNPSAPLFNPSPFLVTPSQAGTTTTTQGTNAGQNASQSAGSTVYPDQPAPVSFAPQQGGAKGTTSTADTSWLDSLFGGSGANSWQTPAASTGPSLDWLTGPVAPSWIDQSVPSYGPSSFYDNGSNNYNFFDASGGGLADPFSQYTSGDGGASLSGLSPGASGSEFDNLFAGL